MNYKESVERAMVRHHEKQLKKDQGPSRKNKAPEKEVEKACLKWARSHGWSVDIIESRGERDQYGTVAVKSGFSDSVGNDAFGRAIYIEFKSPGRAVFSAVRPSQMDFLEGKIKTNAFAVVVDSVEMLIEYYSKWVMININDDRRAAREYLESILPKPRPSTKPESDIPW